MASTRVCSKMNRSYRIERLEKEKERKRRWNFIKKAWELGTFPGVNIYVAIEQKGTFYTYNSTSSPGSDDSWPPPDSELSLKWPQPKRFGPAHYQHLKPPCRSDRSSPEMDGEELPECVENERRSFRSISSSMSIDIREMWSRLLEVPTLPLSPQFTSAIHRHIVPNLDDIRP